MRMQHYPITWLSAAAVLFTGCSSAQSPGAPPAVLALKAGATQGVMGTLGSLPRQLLYVSGPGRRVTLYAPGDKMGSSAPGIGSITEGVNGPAGLAVDTSGNLYVGNLRNSTVTVYERESRSPSETLTNAGKPFAVAVARDGTVYVANVGHGTPPSGASILEYPKGQEMPSHAIPIAGGSFPKGLALDSSGNLFAIIDRSLGHSTYRAAVYEFAPGSSHGKNLGLRRLPTDQLRGIAIDKHDNLLVVDGWQLMIFPPGRQQPIEKIDAGRYVTQVLDVAINRENNAIWITANSCFGDGKVLEFTYPSGKLVDMISGPSRERIGIAVSPASND